MHAHCHPLNALIGITVCAQIMIVDNDAINQVVAEQVKRVLYSVCIPSELSKKIDGTEHCPGLGLL
jgi:hypothetical protein